MRLRLIRCKDITGGIHLLPYVEYVHHSADTYEIHSLSKRYLCVSRTEFYTIENKIAEHVAIFLLPDKKNIAFTANIKKYSQLPDGIVCIFMILIGPEKSDLRLEIILLPPSLPSLHRLLRTS